MVDLGTLGGASSAAYGISNAGQIVGYAQTAASQTHAVEWTVGGDFNRDSHPDLVWQNSTGQVGLVWLHERDTW